MRVMPIRRALSAAVLCVGFSAAFVPAAGCGSQVALDKALQITDVQSGYTDMGLVKGETKLVPSAVIRVKNIGAETIPGFQLSASFWRVGEDGQKDEIILPHTVAKDLAPGAVSDPISIRANSGYTLEGARPDFFAHSLFVDFTIRVIGKINGRPYRIGEVKVDRKILTKDATVPTM
jgi:hypothetical protein